ncbi:hypothetical protein [Streptomyces sp. GS7]|uniref:hypothetical protein n=1 Tax=Streptomyces sp. GS7 TaxID=2692234 RepID=UPI001315D624|nr:hypothetical protein [Streptomyces sp. GS7]QHC20643.1 hypothetical protein GR130_03535 [Streptomyces sp. GS7]
MRPARSATATVRTAGAAVAAGAVLLVSGCAGPDALLRDEGPAAARSTRSGPVYVADGTGRPLQRPDSLPLGDAARLTGLHWTSWGGPTALASGGLSADWCAPECFRRPYDVKVTLSGLQRLPDVAYYSSVGVVAPQVHGERAAELGRVSLRLPEI